MLASRAAIALLIGSSLLVGCASGSGGHRTCKDAASAQAYGVKWQEELASARAGNKISMDEAVAAQGKVYENFGLLKRENWAAFCNHLDAVRTDAGF